MLAVDQTNQERVPVSRAEAIKNLNVKQAKLLDTGEILLGNGKIIGHRSYAYIYKQRYRIPDKRESVLKNKLNNEYRKINKIAGEDMQALK